MSCLARAAWAVRPISSIVSKPSSGVISREAGYQSRQPRVSGSSWSWPHAYWTYPSHACRKASRISPASCAGRAFLGGERARAACGQSAGEGDREPPGAGRERYRQIDPSGARR